jgi:putative chitinase
MKINEITTNSQVEEDMKSTLGSLATAGAIAAGGVGSMAGKQAIDNYFNKTDTTTAKVAQASQKTPEIPRTLKAKKPEVKKADAAKPETKAEPKKEYQSVTGHAREEVLYNAAVAAGLQGEELAAFMAQCAHETMDFKRLVEYGGSLDFRKYDPRYNKAKAKQLGNKYAGDGARYKGRGFIQITGRYNYAKAGRAIGVNLVKHPELAAREDIAAKIAIWYWQHRVQPRVQDWSNVKQVTKPINPALRGLEDRIQNFKQFNTAIANTKSDNKNA